jgi:hypothetical protein
MKTYLHFLSYLAEFLLKRDIFQEKVLDKIETHIVCWVTFSRKSSRFWDVENYYSHTGHRWQHNKPHVLCMLDKYGYRHTFIVFYSYCFPTSTRLRERDSILRYTYTASLVLCILCKQHTLEPTNWIYSSPTSKWQARNLLNIGSLKVIYRIQNTGIDPFIKLGLPTSLQMIQFYAVLVFKFNQCLSHLLLKTILSDFLCIIS